jgi:hypothetical protein
MEKIEKLVCRSFILYFISYKIGNEIFRVKNPDSIYYRPPPLLSWRLKGEGPRSA